MKTNQLQNVESLHKFQTISYKNLETIDGGHPLIFIGKAILSGIGYGIGYIGMKKIFK
ncbi:hypothetical protein [Enterococcus cecorum]|uniref:hypothetical protein n=1 Tax=Enterococcus cecorum TaxID=44008 RepID=UPI00148B8EF9|nr:hypothetical protein [Enterococcus cecorum]